jgi:mRNA-degrading endonuclease YafQ of YafQ-DinJ toxin-antitoxin module
MQIVQKNSFARVYKKLHANQIAAVDCAIEEIAKNPHTGEHKHGDLDWLWVYKFKVLGQLTLLGYSVTEDGDIILILVALGSHENFYRNLKN